MNVSTWKMNASTWKMNASTWKMNANTWMMNEATMSTHLQSTPPTLDSEFVLHTRKVCNSANIASNMPVLCVVDADCNNDPAAPSQDVKCNATTWKMNASTWKMHPLYQE